MNTVLVVDDDPHIRKLMRIYLEKNQLSVLEASDGEAALDLLSTTKVDLVIVDVMMPRMDGIELTQDIRSYTDIPILMVTAKGESKDKVKGFHVGTDDYVVKPFDPVELVLRVQSLLKRYNKSLSHIIQLAGVTIDLERLIVEAEGRTIDLKKKECELLFSLASKPGKICTRHQLIYDIWGMDYEGDERTVDVHIKRLRERLESVSQFTISTVRGLGYRLELT
ncbi:response regulator transcription factor [Paenibacillus silvae]|uniref:response regulator transcription factor n=1 Tax=Paenibacillus silvae TaxID=1325358 RepID=UPI002004428F|nr:response regulator transcription factor [Paenibacillus silvae]MCK6073699.1 response regulator transcription factor [Paenibacillus silvae]MCK6148824.1 response regulator transcription factor [Paenibacillus silvae]MCK6267125.1 response regulator transcription factor [Paenibacillus silvae]